jgi:hypothetical protein
VAKRLPQDVYQTLIDAGWPAQAAVTLTAIAGAESGYDDTNLGDVNLENTTWGPSYGLFQIRTLKSATGTGADRDISRLAAGDDQQAAAAWDISRGGTDFSPWSTYTSGAYQRFLPDAQAAATTPRAGLAGVIPDWANPASWVSDLVSGGRDVGLQVLAVGAGVILVGAGLYVLARPKVTAAVDRVRDTLGGGSG